MKFNFLLAPVFLALLVLGFAQGEQGDADPNEAEGARLEEPISSPLEGFREIGSYRVQSSTLLKLGKATDMMKGEILFRVFTDGIDVRLSPDGADESYLSFQIYRASETYDETGKNLLPGMKAFSDQGEVVRHLCVEPKLLTLTKFPTSSSNIEVIYAVREN